MTIHDYAVCLWVTIEYYMHVKDKYMVAVLCAEMDRIKYNTDEGRSW